MKDAELIRKILDRRTAVIQEEMKNLEYGDVQHVSCTSQVAEIAVIRSLFEILIIARKHGGFEHGLSEFLEELGHAETFLNNLGLASVGQFIANEEPKKLKEEQ